jgi:hypothetical protein
VVAVVNGVIGLIQGFGRQAPQALA